MHYLKLKKKIRAVPWFPQHTWKTGEFLRILCESFCVYYVRYYWYLKRQKIINIQGFFHFSVLCFQKTYDYFRPSQCSSAYLKGRRSGHFLYLYVTTKLRKFTECRTRKINIQDLQAQTLLSYSLLLEYLRERQFLFQVW